MISKLPPATGIPLLSNQPGFHGRDPEVIDGLGQMTGTLLLC